MNDNWFKPWCDACLVRPGKGTDGPVFTCTERDGCHYAAQYRRAVERNMANERE